MLPGHTSAAEFQPLSPSLMHLHRICIVFHTNPVSLSVINSGDKSGDISELQSWLENHVSLTTQERQNIPMTVAKVLVHYRSSKKLIFYVERGDVTSYILQSDNQQWPFQKKCFNSYDYSKNIIGWVAFKQ